MSINPDIEEAHALRGWYDSIGSNQPFQSHSSALSGGGMSTGSFDRGAIRSLAFVKNNGLGTDDRVDYFSARATVMHIKSDNISYPACPTQGCNKKVVEGHDGWRCEKCDKSYEKPEHRYVRPTILGIFVTECLWVGISFRWLLLIGQAKLGYKVSTTQVSRYSECLPTSWWRLGSVSFLPRLIHF
jgi:ribosomal protein L37AE/L43A